MNTGTEISYIPPVNYYILEDDVVVKDGDMYWSLATKNWRPCGDSCHGDTVKVNKQQYRFIAAARKITATHTLEAQIIEAKNVVRVLEDEYKTQLHKIIEAKNVVRVLEDEYKTQLHKKLLDEAKAAGWEVGVTVGGKRGGQVTEIFVVDETNYSWSSVSVNTMWCKTKKPFIAACYANSISPISQLSIDTAPPSITLYGYELGYSKGGTCVDFGCAKISVELLRAVMKNEADANRFVSNICLDTGKVIKRGEIHQILDYVNYINKQ